MFASLMSANETRLAVVKACLQADDTRDVIAFNGDVCCSVRAK